MIQATDICKSYGELKVLDKINFTVEDGEIFGLVGRSGVGKSTLLRCLNGLESYDSGSLKVCGTEVGALIKRDIRLFRKNVGMVFQNYSLITRATVYENIALAMKIWKYSNEQIEKRVRELLEIVELPEKISCRARELSGGQKQRVAIARALAMNPSILLCDEATSALDPKSTASIISLLQDINSKLKITVVMVTHEMDVITKLCDRVAIIEDGVIKASGTVERMFIDRPEALNNLLGEKEIHIPEDGSNLQISYNGGESDAYIFSQMARELGIPFRVVGNEAIALKNKTVNSMLINIDNREKARVCGYLNKHSITFKELNRE